MDPQKSRQDVYMISYKSQGKERLINLLFKENDRAGEMAHGIKALAIQSWRPEFVPPESL